MSNRKLSFNLKVAPSEVLRMRRDLDRIRRDVQRIRDELNVRFRTADDGTQTFAVFASDERLSDWEAVPDAPREPVTA